ncbi:MAG: sulfatase-like hydrolase/transferase, partial [Brumimicrobium sp.]
MITLEPIGSTLFEFDPDQMGMVASNFVIFKWYYLLLLLPPFVYFLFLRVFRNNKLFNLIAVIFLVASVGAISFDFQIKQAGEGYRSGDLIQNKTYFLITSLLEKSNYENLSSYEKAIVRYQQLEKNKAFINQEFPFIHKRSNKNTLAPFFDLKETPPNIVFIIVESLSSSYSGKNADEISFTPFLDSLEEHSIYFENMLATGERTFSVLPNVIGSLPHGKKGFTNTKNSFPTHISLANWIFENNYEGAFYYGGYARFDHMDLYMNHEGFDPIFDRKEYNYEGKDVKTSIDPVPFGVGDREL